jgi:hypothetical protein
MRPLLAALVLAIGFAPQLPGSAQEPPPAPQGPRLQLTFEGNGNVTLISNGATLQEILREWTAKGGTPFVGAERLSGAGMTLQYTTQPETEVLRSLLRAASGLILAPRREGSVGASQFEAVYVVATSNATASSSFGGSTYSTPSYTQPTVSTTGNPSTEVPPVGAGGAAAGTAGAPAANNAGPGPQQQQQAPPPDYPAATSGVRPVAISIVPVPSAGSTTTTTPPPPATTPPPASTPPPANTGRGGGGGGGGIR